MGNSSIALEIAGLQAQLDVLKALVAANEKEVPSKGVHLADLCGIWKGKVNLSLEEIQAEEYKIPENLFPE